MVGALGECQCAGGGDWLGGWLGGACLLWGEFDHGGAALLGPDRTHGCLKLLVRETCHLKIAQHLNLQVSLLFESYLLLTQTLLVPHRSALWARRISPVRSRSILDKFESTVPVFENCTVIELIHSI